MDNQKVSLKNKDLENLAFECKEAFYALPESERRTFIVVKGGEESQRTYFISSLRKIVDVFVSDKTHVVSSDGAYVINLGSYLWN